jgi:hypothetical protein
MKRTMNLMTRALLAATMTLGLAGGCDLGERSIDQASAESRGRPDKPHPKQDVEQCTGVDADGNVFVYDGPCIDDCDDEW